jgi:NAD(P)-dependent dehydrogenase (short-subunit alcohol dehydrogenase family)
MRLKSKVAIVTGGTRGIGYSIAKKFLKEGAIVFVLDKSSKSVKKISEQFKVVNSDSDALVCDISNENSVDLTIKKIVGTYKVNVLVNNAGINPSPKKLTKTSTEEWDKIINTNLRGVFLISKCVIPNMQEGASVINISSILGYKGVKDCSAYIASKGGIIALTKSMARDYAPSIRVNCICPGPIDTRMFEDYIKRCKDPKIRQMIINGIPLRRIGKPEDVANAAIFLASDEASWITGINLTVDGGDSI